MPIDDVRRYNESTYNKYGWAYVCGALDEYSGRAFLKAISETATGQLAKTYNYLGDLVISVGSDAEHFDNVIICCDDVDALDEPTVIHEVYVINDLNKVDIDKLRRYIVDDTQ